MKWLASLFVAAVLCVPAGAVDFWLTDDIAGSSVADFKVDIHEGAFELYAWVNSVDDIDTLRMWSGVVPGIAEIVDVQTNVGIPQANVVLPDETLYGATDIGLNGDFLFATLTVNPLVSGTAEWLSFPVQIIPGDGLSVVGEPTMHIVPEPEAALLAVMGLGLCLVAVRRKR